MRVLHAYICEEYYRNWAKEQSYLGLHVSRDAFLRQVGTPMILFETHQKEGFFPVLEGGYILVNPNYHMDCQEYRTNPPSIQPSEQLASVIESALQSPTITSIRTRIFSWLGL